MGGISKSNPKALVKLPLALKTISHIDPKVRKRILKEAYHLYSKIIEKRPGYKPSRKELSQIENRFREIISAGISVDKLRKSGASILQETKVTQSNRVVGLKKVDPQFLTAFALGEFELIIKASEHRKHPFSFESFKKMQIGIIEKMEKQSKNRIALNKIKVWKQIISSLKLHARNVFTFRRGFRIYKYSFWDDPKDFKHAHLESINILTPHAKDFGDTTKPFKFKARKESVESVLKLDPIIPAFLSKVLSELKYSEPHKKSL